MIGELSFSGGVFSEKIDGGRAGAEIELSREGISAHTPDGEQFFIDYGECQLELGGFSGRMFFCRNEDRSLTIFCEDRKFAAALSESSIGVLDEKIDGTRRKRRAESRGRLWIGTAVLAVVAVLIVAGYFGIRAAARAAVQALPVSVDRKIGEMAFKSMDLGGSEVKDAVVVEAIQAMVDRLAPHSATDDMEFDVHVVNSPQVNAFALPGGKIVVFTGLIAKADEAEQVAGVLGHEMAHATLRHGLQRIGQSLGFATAFQLVLGDAQGVISAGAELIRTTTINSYSREHENEADEEGVRMLHAAGIDPLAMARFFETLKGEHGELPGVVSWLSTHPQHETRIAAVKSQLATLPTKEYRPMDVDWGEVQRRIKIE